MILGAIPLLYVFKHNVSPTYIRHAVPDVLPDVPSEPILVEGSVIQGRLTHELIETPEQWHFRPDPRLWRNDKYFLFGFGIPFSMLFAAGLSWHLHNEPKIGSWPVAILLAVFAIAVSGGPVLLLIGLAHRARHRRLAHLRIFKYDDEIELDLSQEPNPKRDDISWFFVGNVKMQRITIPHESLVAVQLCPWKFEVGRSGEKTMTWTVQGVLVFQHLTEDAYHRLPILLTSDSASAAQLMQQLAQVLHIPYLFHADSEGWKRELQRARTRLPLQAGGT